MKPSPGVTWHVLYYRAGIKKGGRLESVLVLDTRLIFMVTENRMRPKSVCVCVCVCTTESLAAHLKHCKGIMLQLKKNAFLFLPLNNKNPRTPQIPLSIVRFSRTSKLGRDSTLGHFYGNSWQAY